MLAKKVSLSLLTVGAISLVVSAASFALFSASTSNQNNTFTAGTVTLGSPTPFTCTVYAGGLAPGDSGNCTVSVQYTGSLDAWLGLTASGSGALFSGATPMTIDHVKPAGGGADLAQVLGKYVIGQKSTGQPAGVEIDYSFPLAADNSYQGASGAINLQFFAVQARNNTNAGNTGPNAWQ